MLGRRWHSVALAAALLGAPGIMPAQTPLTSVPKRAAFDAREAAFLGLLLVGGGLLDQQLRAEAQEHRSPTSDRVAGIGNAVGDARYVMPVLGAAHVIGRLTHDTRLSGASLRAFRTAVVASAASGVFKLAVGRGRPDVHGDADAFRPFGGWSSFPSGHTTIAFAVAGSLARETDDRWSDALLYGAATLTAFARINDDRHWVSDVIMGAAIGELTARALQYRQGTTGLRLVLAAGRLGVTASF